MSMYVPRGEEVGGGLQRGVRLTSVQVLTRWSSVFLIV